MNDNLAKLMRDHGLHQHITQDCQHRMEMLARLIVEECAGIADADDRRPAGVGCGYITRTKGQLIKQHFGVE